MFEYDKHYRECQQNNQPFIKARINPSTGNYYVQIDLMTCDYELTIEGQNYVKQLFENELVFIKSDNSKSTFKDYSIDEELSWVDGVLPKRLNSFCEQLYDLSQKYHN